MENMGVEKNAKDDLMFFSFIQSSRQGTQKKYAPSNDKNDVIVINDSEDEDSEMAPELELLCEIEFESGMPLPLPKEQKAMCKTEIDQDNIQDNNQTIPLMTSHDQSGLLDECEDELLPLCKIESDCVVGEDNALIERNATDSYILFVCPQCNRNFENSSSWREHILKVHNFNEHRTLDSFLRIDNNEFECKNCRAVITRCTLKTLQQHFFSHLPYKMYKCMLCHYNARSLFLMISHVMLHKEQEESCVDPIPTHKSTLKTEALEQESRRFITYICPVCGQSFNVKENWNAHINFKHNFLEKTAENRYKNHFKCTECGVEIFSQHVTDLQNHLFTHFPYRSFLHCNICGFAISKLNFMLSHILNLHSAHLSLELLTTNTKPSQVNSPNFQYNSSDDDWQPENESISYARSPRKAPAQSTEDNMSSLSLSTSYASQEISTTTVVANTTTRIAKKSGFRCCGCSRHFKTADERNAHNVAEHAKYKCSDCSKPFAKKSDFRTHSCKEDIDTQKQCNICLKIYNYGKCYESHVRKCRQAKRKRIANNTG